MVEAAVPPFAAMPNLQAGEGKRPTLAMSGLSCVLDSYARVTVDNHLPQHSDNYPGVDCILQRSYSCLAGRLCELSPTHSAQSAELPFIYDGMSYLNLTLRITKLND